MAWLAALCCFQSLYIFKLMCERYELDTQLAAHDGAAMNRYARGTNG